MIQIKDGILQSPRIVPRVIDAIGHGPLKNINAVVVHQTNSSTAASTLAQYRNVGGNGAHFLIDKDGRSTKLCRSW